MRYRLLIVLTGLLGLTSGAWGRNAIRVPAQTGAEEIRYVQDEFIVVLRDGVPAGLQTGMDAAGRPSVNTPSLQVLLERHGVSGFRRQFPGTLRSQPAGVPNLATYYKVRVPEGSDLDAVIADFASDANVDHVEKIGIHPFHLEPNDPYYDDPPPDFPHNAWHIKQSADHDIDGNLAWDVETGDATVVVGIMDSGVRYYHIDLGGSNPPGPADNSTNGNIWVNTEEIPGNSVDDDGNGLVDDVVGYDFVNTSAPDKCAADWGEDCLTPDNDPRDFGGHGSAVAGCVAAVTNNGYSVVGVAGGYNNGTASGTANGVKLMCLRIGWQAKDGYGYVRMDFAAEAVYYAVQKKLDGHNVVALNCSWGTSSTGGFAAAVDLALANDIMVIHAAGNGGNDTPDYLGSKAGAMNVAATDSNDVRCSFSDYGDWVDLAAPGDDIMTTYHSFDDPDYDYVVVIGGTSFSSPLTCGVAALLESRDPSLTGPEKFDIIVSTGDDIGSQNIGLRLNARNALDAVGACVDAAAPSVTVLGPNGGESVAVESTLVITWDASDDCLVAETEVRLDRGDDGVFEESLVVLPGNPGAYSWHVTGPATTLARIQVIATDGESNTTADVSGGTFAITLNQAPVLMPLTPQAVDEGANLNLAVSAIDADGDSLILTAQDVPVNASFTDHGDGSGTFDFNPDYAQASVFDVMFVASDGILADTQAVAITVVNVNRTPILDPIGAQLVDEGQNLSFGVTAVDPDGDGVDLAAADIPDNATFADYGDGTGLFTFDPDYTQAGTYEVLITASDGASEDSVTVGITVTDAPPPCACDCHADPHCDGQTDILDAVRLVEVAFRGGAPLPDPNPLCPFETTDVNCDGATSVLDAVLIVDVAFRGSDPQISFTAPCP